MAHWLPSGSGPSGWSTSVPSCAFRSAASRAARIRPAPPGPSSRSSEDDRERNASQRARASARARGQLKRLLAPGCEARQRVRRPSATWRCHFGQCSATGPNANCSVRRRPIWPIFRADERWAVLVDLGAIGIASADIEGYLRESDVAGVVRDYPLVEADSDANVVLHVIPDAQYPYPDSRLRLAAESRRTSRSARGGSGSRVAARTGPGVEGGGAMIVLPAMSPEQTASWLGLLDLHERLTDG